MKYIIIYGLVIILIYVQYMAKKFENPYKLVMIWGKKGSGKTTLATKLALKHMKQGQPVFSNAEIYGTLKLDTKDIGFRTFPPHSVLIIDEAGLIWDSRNFKSFDLTNVGRYFRLQRQYKNTVYLFSQDFSIDKRLRDLCDEMYLCVNVFGFLSIAKKIHKIPKLHKASQDQDGSSKNEGFITEDYRYFLPFSWIYTYIPRYIKFFSSFSPDPLPDVIRKKYYFKNDLYLWNYQRYDFYKKEQVLDIKRYFAKLRRLYRLSARITPEELLNLTETV